MTRSRADRPTPQLRERRWNYFRDNLIRKHGELVYKIGVDGGFDCPNRDGTKAYGGCAYCSQEGSLSPHQDAKLEIPGQIQRGKAFVLKRYGARKVIVYFQAFTNTYAAVPVLKERFESALGDPAVVGLSVATRPDCIDEEKVAYLAQLKERLPFFAIELGLQSAHQNRLDWVNRHESIEDYVQAMDLLNRYQVPVVTHVILGFPGESSQDMEDTVNLAQNCQTSGIKLQMLHVIRGTKLAHMYQQNPFPLFTMEEYRELLIHSVERLNPQIEIHRITGETEDASLVAPEWVKHKTLFFDGFEKELERRQTWQGKYSQNYFPGALPSFPLLSL